MPRSPSPSRESCKNRALKFVLGAAVQVVERSAKGAKVAWKARKDDKPGEVEADVVLVATGRKPFTAGLGWKAWWSRWGRAGTVKTDDHFRTIINGLSPSAMHRRADAGPQGRRRRHGRCGNHGGKHGHVNYNVSRRRIHHARSGLGGRHGRAVEGQGRAYKVGKFSFMGNGRAKAVFQAEGFVKILADKDTDRILGGISSAGGGRPDPRELRGHGIRAPRPKILH